MPKSYVEVGSSNCNVMGKNISFFHFSEQSKKERGWEKMGSSTEACKRRWQPLVSRGDLCIHVLEHVVTG